MGTDQSPKADNNEDEHPPRGQNRNRRPAPAQRNGNGEEELTDKQKVLMDLAEMGYALNQFGNYQRTDESTGTPLQAPEDVLITRIYDHRQKFGKRPISKERIKDILVENAQTHWENLYVKKVREVEFTSGTPNKVEDLCRAIAGPNFHPLYPVVLNHIAWSIKRRMRQMPVDYPILINFSGPEECGKSFLVRRMCEAVLPIRQFEELKDSGAILSNMERSGYLFTDRLVVVLGELTNMERVSIDVLKDLIDAEEIAYRRFFTQRSANGPNRAQLIGTSNRHLREIFPRDEFIRKYCNVCFDDCPREERVNVRWKIVDDFNFSEWFRSINESGPSPLAPVYPKFREWVKTDCYRPTETEVWLSGYISLHPGDERQFAAIWDDYQKNPHLPKAKLGRDNFQRLLVRQGCERKTVSGRSHYILPAITTPLDGWDAYFPQTIDDIKARVFGKGKPD
ncbi:MAG TPA: hypothetical protein PKJ98_07380 [Verrucomicrobiota bacterium]|nr:hypothetical protein [Verrucomicrobiota bacterium]